MVSTKFSSYLILFILLPAMVWLFANTIVNRHIHVLSDGYIVSHAHPFNTPHQHTKKELFLLDLFYIIVFSSITILVIRSFLSTCPLFIRFRVNHQVPARKHYHVYHYHAPPFPG
jgi:hypothetical protein